MRLDPFYLIVSDLAEMAPLVACGARLVQLRLKGATPPEVRRQIAAARDLCAAHGAQLVVNDHWRAAIDLGCDAVHLGQEDMDTADFPALRRAGVAFGLSTHDAAELERAMALAPAYVALGPVWPTALKVMPWAPQGLERVTDWKRRAGKVPLVGIGGITPDRAALLLAAGADSAAVVTDIAQAPDPVARCRAWIAATEPWR